MGVAIGATAAATLDRERQRIGTSRLAIAAALAVLAALLVETQLDPLVVGVFPTSAAAYGLGVPPGLLARWIIVRSLGDAPAASGTIYAFDLAGAATDGLLGYLAIGTLGDQALYGLASALCLVAATLFVRPSASRIGLRRVSAIVAAVGLVAMLGVWGELLAPPRPGPLKSTGGSRRGHDARYRALGSARARRRDALRIARRFHPLRVPHRSELSDGVTPAGACHGARHGSAHADHRDELAQRPRGPRRERPRGAVRAGRALERARHRSRRGPRRDDGAPTRRAVGHRGRGQPRGRRADARALRRIQRRGLCGHACPPGRGRGAQLRAPFRRSLRPGRHDRGR